LTRTPVRRSVNDVIEMEEAKDAKDKLVIGVRGVCGGVVRALWAPTESKW
jgi:hypothetical protein